MHVRGWHVFPLHEPLFDEDGNCTGCTCEHYKRSDRYRQWLESRGRGSEFNPNFKCRNQGKHPRGSDRDGIYGFQMATTDEDQIRKWWSRWPTANIGWLPGRSGHAVLDADSYKDEYAGDGMLTADEEETVTQISGGGGSHLIYRKHEGATYANAAGDLPAGIDVHADNGYIVLAPSLHESGRRYAWELEYGPHEIDAQLLPDRIHDELITASQRTQNTTFNDRPVWNGTPSTEPPELAVWGLPASIVDLINEPPERGYRSEADAKIVTALCYAGATDDDILAVFEHLPIGVDGKFAERGLDYLGRTITNARRYVADNPPPPDVSKLIDVGYDWVSAANFAEHVPIELQASDGYRTNERDKAGASGILDIFKQYGRISGPIGIRQLAERMGCGRSTAKRALENLNGWFIEKESRAHCYEADRYELHPNLIDELRTWDTYHKSDASVTCPTYATTPFHTHKAHDAYARSLSEITPEEVEARNAERRANGDEPMRMTVTLRKRLAASLPSAGRGVLLVIDALVRLEGQATASELMAATHKKKWSISRYLRKAVQLELVEYDGDVAVLRSDWEEWTEQITPFMPTAGNQIKQKVSNANDVMAHCDSLLRNEQDESRRKELHRRRAKAVKRKLRAFKMLTPEIPEKELWQIADKTTPVMNWFVMSRLAEFHATARMDRVEERRHEQWETTQQLLTAVDQLRRDQVPRSDWYRQLRWAGFTESEAARGMKARDAA